MQVVVNVIPEELMIGIVVFDATDIVSVPTQPSEEFVMLNV